MQVNSTVSRVLQSTSPLQSQEALMNYSTALISRVNDGRDLEPKQKLRIRGYSNHLPLICKIVETAYRDFNAGTIVVSLKEQALEDLKKKYDIQEDFDYKKQIELELKRYGAANITFDDSSLSPYVEAGVSVEDAQILAQSISDFIPPDVMEELQINPEEILSGCLNLQRGQPLAISGSREHLSQILSLAEWAYKNGTKLVEISMDEKRDFDLNAVFFKYASEEVLIEAPEYITARPIEFLEKDTATLTLEGSNPNRYKDIDPRRIQLAKKSRLQKTRAYRDRLIIENPWCMYYLPTTALATFAGYENLKAAASEAKKINRVGKLTEHIKNLKETENKLNLILKQGFNTLHFISVEPDTENPDGKTDLKIELTPKSFFVSGTAITPKGQTYIPNVPTEECFTTPDCTKAEGKVSMTRPVSLNGVLVEGIQMEFSKGQIIKVNATKNLDVLQKWLEKNENANRLGEVALVAGSPIFDLGRIFNSILIDENSTCHIALGSSYADCIEGTDKITDHKEREAYMNSLNCNNSPVHVDFMIGGPNVMVIAKKSNGGDTKVLIRENKFQF